MSILQIQQRLLENAEQISLTERAFGRQQSRSLQSSLKSLYKLRKYLEYEFEEVAYTAQVDVVSYRIFEGNERPTMMLLGRALDSFQTLYAIMYATVSTGLPRDTAHLSSMALQTSSMEFAYAYSGSVGFVFTVPNERLLFSESKLDEAMGRLAEIATASSTEEIKGLAPRFGLAPIRAAYKWLSALSSSSVGVDIEWKKGQAVSLNPSWTPSRWMP